MKKTYILFAFCGAITFMIASSIYVATRTPIFKANTEFQLIRPTLQNPHFTNPKIHDRWVWLRDGTRLKHLILSDAFLTKLAKNNKTSVQNLRSNFKIVYSGGDTNHFSISFTNENSDAALKVLKQTLNQITTHFSEQRSTTANVALLQIEVEIESLDPKTALDKNNLEVLRDAYAKLKLDKILRASEDKNTVEVLVAPNASNQAIWPKKALIVCFFTITGLLLGLAAAILWVNIFKLKTRET